MCGPTKFFSDGYSSQHHLQNQIIHTQAIPIITNMKELHCITIVLTLSVNLAMDILILFLTLSA